ncbi:hypothetical protein F5148DRAFT_1286754 [Russula earlei]|uniref:Uncharacterized protein n=1 Tax=Russula earlei TaxID=71964 RepID=A0ACC0U3S5_9AGAM|nr:hypothetical protein F5148DRAFT_1286754 [Russula earlei]
MEMRAVKDKERGTEVPPDPAALRARLKHRTPLATPTAAAGQPSAAASSYDAVLDTARRLAELEHQRAQDAAYIRSLEQARASLLRDAQSTARARAEAERATAGEREAGRGRAAAEAARAEAERVVGSERARAERAEARVRTLEAALGVAAERVRELEGALEGERRRREEWERGLEDIAFGTSVAS